MICPIIFFLLDLVCLSKPLAYDKWRMFLPQYLIVWECQGSASRPVDNRGDMAGWSRTRVQGAWALDTQRAWACPRSHTAPGDDVMSHAPTPQQRLYLVSSLLCPGLGVLLRPQKGWMPRELWFRPLLSNRCASLWSHSSLEPYGTKIFSFLICDSAPLEAVAKTCISLMPQRQK